MSKRKPQKTREQIEAEAIAKRALDLEAVNVPPEAAILPRQAHIEVTRKAEKRGTQVVEENTARRLDAFEALKSSFAAGCYDAARRFEIDILIRRGENERGRPTERVNRTAGPTTDAMVQAAQRIEAVLDRISPRDGWLLQELICPAIDRGTWRDHVAYITGEAHPMGQAAAVKAVCVNLRDAYTAIERRAA